MVNEKVNTQSVPQDVVGVGVDRPEECDAMRFRAEHGTGLECAPYLLYVGPIRADSGCRELVSHFVRLREDSYACRAKLVLMGPPEMEVLEHPDILLLEPLSIRQRFEAMAAAAALVVPSPQETFPLSILEAWSVGTPVLVPYGSGALRSHCIQSGGGIWYDGYAEFREAAELLLEDTVVRGSLGNAGRSFVETAYSWERIETKYRELVERETSGRRNRRANPDRGR